MRLGSGSSSGGSTMSLPLHRSQLQSQSLGRQPRRSSASSTQTMIQSLQHETPPAAAAALSGSGGIRGGLSMPGIRGVSASGGSHAQNQVLIRF